MISDRNERLDASHSMLNDQGFRVLHKAKEKFATTNRALTYLFFIHLPLLIPTGCSRDT